MCIRDRYQSRSRDTAVVFTYMHIAQIRFSTHFGRFPIAGLLADHVEAVQMHCHVSGANRLAIAYALLCSIDEVGFKAIHRLHAYSQLRMCFLRILGSFTHRFHRMVPFLIRLRFPEMCIRDRYSTATPMP